MREALNLALDEALGADDRVFLLGEDIADPGASGPTAGLSTKYGHERVLDTPISEAGIVGAAIGAAIDGMLPVAAGTILGLGSPSGQSVLVASWALGLTVFTLAAAYWTRGLRRAQGAMIVAAYLVFVGVLVIAA